MAGSDRGRIGAGPVKLKFAKCRVDNYQLPFRERNKANCRQQPQRSGARETNGELPLHSGTMSQPPKIYRLYCYDGARQIVTADLIEVASDEEAIFKAQAAGFGSRCEIWEGKRLVAQLEEERRQA